MFIKKKIKKRFIDNKHQFNCVYEYVRNTADEVDKKTAIKFCDYVIDILCKNIESNMQLNFINHNVDDLFSHFTKMNTKMKIHILHSFGLLSA